MSLINISNLTFAYEGSYDNIFENVSFQLDTDWKTGFTGRNGRGKTTFLRLLLGELEYSGKISASVNFEYFPYHISDPDNITSEIVGSIAESAEDWEILREINLLGVSHSVLERPFSSLSMGERTKVLLAALFLRENAFLLIDEPTNHLDAEGRRLVAEYLNGKSGFILVSHDRNFLDSCVDHILSINKTNIEVQRGNFSSWYYNKQLRDNYELAENERLAKEIKKLESASRQAKQWADKVESTKIGYDPRREERNIGSRSYIGEQSRRMQQRRKNLERRQNRAIEEARGLLHNIEEAEDLKLFPLDYHSERLVQLRNLSIAYGDRIICSGVSFELLRGDRCAILGHNGSGKSSILKLIAGDDGGFSGSFSGDFYQASGLKISYVAQDTSNLSGSLDDYARSFSVDIPLFKAILRKLDFARVQFEKPLESLSAGQKKKVTLARSLCERAHLYIWDEPLNFIDVLSRIQIEDLLLKYAPTILFVEHDAAFCENVATKTIVL